MHDKLPISIIMLTLNEASNLPGAIENVQSWAQEIFIVDSLSSDCTVDLALERGVKVVQRPFTNFGDQWNFALEKLPVTTPWTCKLDPDERFSNPLVEEIARSVHSENSKEGFGFRRRLWFMGKPMNITQKIIRLWKTGSCRFTDVIVNEHPIIQGEVGYLKGILEHRDSCSLHDWWDKQNRYTTMEAIMRARGDHLAAEPKLFGNALQRRMFLKKIFPKIPFRFSFLFFADYILRGAFLNGYRGWEWAHLRSELYRMIDLKAKEMAQSGIIPEVPKKSGNWDARIVGSPLQQLVMKEEK
jgi:glycosyltransferase involved in cell wall biosynthesis